MAGGLQQISSTQSAGRTAALRLVSALIVTALITVALIAATGTLLGLVAIPLLLLNEVLVRAKGHLKTDGEHPHAHPLAAFQLAQPDSWWARHLYTRRKRHRARRRYWTRIGGERANRDWVIGPPPSAG